MVLRCQPGQGWRRRLWGAVCPGGGPRSCRVPSRKTALPATGSGVSVFLGAVTKWLPRVLPSLPPLSLSSSEGLRSSCRFSIDLECAGLKHHVIISGDVCLSGQANKGLAQGTFRSCLQAQVGSYGHSGTVNEQLPEGSTRLKGWLPVQADRCEQEVERDEGPATQL